MSSLVGMFALGAASCSLDGLLKSDQIPTNVTDPAITKTPDGAMAVYHGALVKFQQGFAGNTLSFVAASGLFGDELQPGRFGSAGALNLLDARLMVASSDVTPAEPYATLQAVRGQSGQAIGLLTDFPPPNAQPLIGHMYALQAYAEVMLAELYCSGVPLSTLDYNGDYTLQPGSTTSDVLHHAVALFDTALALAGDSVRVAQLAAVGKGRALLGLGQYAAAVAAVAPVPDAFQYDVRYAPDADNNLAFASFRANDAGQSTWNYSVADREGVNGLDYISSGDPRTASTSSGSGAGTSVYGYPIYLPEKYPDASTSVTLASGVEARLIRAEAALQGGDVGSWLTMLNQLRVDGGGLAPLDDPGASISDPVVAEAARVDLMFRERAFWLFLTGHREGDMRRLIRQYGRTQGELYPVGAYPSGPGVQYGIAVFVPVPLLEKNLNARYTGCFPSGA